MAQSKPWEDPAWHITHLPGPGHYDAPHGTPWASACGAALVKSVSESRRFLRCAACIAICDERARRGGEQMSLFAEGA